MWWEIKFQKRSTWTVPKCKLEKQLSTHKCMVLEKDKMTKRGHVSGIINAPVSLGRRSLHSCYLQMNEFQFVVCNFIFLGLGLWISFFCCMQHNGLTEWGGPNSSSHQGEGKPCLPKPQKDIPIFKVGGDDDRKDEVGPDKRRKGFRERELRYGLVAPTRTEIHQKNLTVYYIDHYKILLNYIWHFSFF